MIRALPVMILAGCFPCDPSCPVVTMADAEGEYVLNAADGTAVGGPSGRLTVLNGTVTVVWEDEDGNTWEAVFRESGAGSG